MSKKKMRAFAGAMAVVLAFVPFLSGCAANDAEDNPQAQQELNADEQSRNGPRAPSARPCNTVRSWL